MYVHYNGDDYQHALHDFIGCMQFSCMYDSEKQILLYQWPKHSNEQRSAHALQQMTYGEHVLGSL